MSDSSIIIVPKRSAYAERESKAQEILTWLVEEEVVIAMPSACVLGQGLGYEMGRRAGQVVVTPASLPAGLAICGLEILLSRQVFDTGSNGLDKLSCPNCQTDIVDDIWDLTDWNEGKSDCLICARCDNASEINSYCFEPAWGFSNLGFRFWNWPELTPTFIAEFRHRLDSEISLVYQHI